jgi:hypothetical protein
MDVGRPTKYSPEIISNSLDYLKSFDFKDGQLRNRNNEYIPTLAGLALWLGISRDTVHDWLRQEKKKEFSYIVSMIKTRQEQLLVNGGVGGDYNPSITKLILNAKHDYVEKNQTDVTSTDGSLNSQNAAFLAALNKKHDNK